MKKTKKAATEKQADQKAGPVDIPPGPGVPDSASSHEIKLSEINPTVAAAVKAVSDGPSKPDEAANDAQGAKPQKAEPPNFQAMETVEELVSSYNEMVQTAIDLGIKKMTTVRTFMDVKTGRLACERLHASILRARDPKPAKGEKDGDGKMAKKAKKSKKSASRSSARAKITGETKVSWSGKANPFRKDSGKWKRTEKVRENSGQTVKTLKSKGVKSGTVRTLHRMKLVSLAG